jgi:hypothetical protein
VPLDQLCFWSLGCTQEALLSPLKILADLGKFWRLPCCTVCQPGDHSLAVTQPVFGRSDPSRTGQKVPHQITRYLRGLGENRTKEGKSFLIFLLLPLHRLASTALSVSSFILVIFLHTPPSFSHTFMFPHFLLHHPNFPSRTFIPYCTFFFTSC